MLPKNVEDAYPLSPMQHLMLLHAISTPGGGVLLNQVCYEIRGPLDAPAFHRAWDALVARHAALRTAFLWEGLSQPLQVVRSSVTLPFREIDLSDVEAAEQARTIERLRREDAGAPVVLGKAPLMRCTLVRLGPGRHYFIWTVHHLIVDRWSHGLLFADLRALYAAYAAGSAPALGPAAPFRRYIEWVAQQDRAAAEAFWRGELAELKEPTSLSRISPSAAHSRRLTARRTLSDDVTASVRARAAQWRTTPGVLLLSAVGLVLAGRTRRNDVICGVTVSGRPPDLPDSDAMVGSFVNNLPARLTVSPDREIAAWVQDSQRAQGRRQVYAHVSVADIHEWSGIPTARPLFDTLLLLNLTDESDLRWPGIELVVDSATLDAAYPLLVSVTVERDRLTFTLVHDTTAGFAEDLLDDLEAVVAKLAAAEGRTLVGELLPVARAMPERRVAAPLPAVHANDSASSTSGNTTADALLGAWRDVLGIATIGLDDDFFALGGTSLQAAQLFARVERITGRILPLSTLLAAGSVRALLTAIDQPVLRASTLVGMRSSGAQPPLYAIPGIGGNVVGLAALARALGADQPFFAFESPGLDGRETPLSSIEAIAERYATDIAREETRLFHLLGLCWGAAVVAEIARRLTAMGRPPMSLSLIDPTSILRETAPRSRLETASFLRSRLELYWDEFREGDWGDRTRMLASKARRAAKVLTGGEERRQSQSELNQFRVIEANKDAVVRYAPAPLQVQARIFITPYRGDGADPRLEWLSLIEPRPDVVPVNGANAGDAIAPANAGELAASLRVWLRAAADAAVAR